MPKSYYAETYWESDNVVEAAKMRDVTLTQEQAHRWWAINERRFLTAKEDTGDEN